MTGRRFGRLTVVRHTEPRKCLCRCDCGVEKTFGTQNVRNGNSKSCGCLKSEAVSRRNKQRSLILSGTYGRLTVIQRRSASVWEFSCACGGKHVAFAAHVVSGATQSCGCLKAELVRARMTGKQLCLKHDLGELRGKERKKAYINMRYQTDPIFRAKSYRSHRNRWDAKKNATEPLSPEQWLLILECFDGRCAYCARADVAMTQDHVLPLSQGGSHSWDNVVPACRSCNSRKRTRSLGKAMEVLGTDRDAFWAAVRKTEERFAS